MGIHFFFASNKSNLPNKFSDLSFSSPPPLISTHHAQLMVERVKSQLRSIRMMTEVLTSKIQTTTKKKRPKSLFCCFDKDTNHLVFFLWFSEASQGLVAAAAAAVFVYTFSKYLFVIISQLLHVVLWLVWTTGI